MLCALLALFVAGAASSELFVAPSGTGDCLSPMGPCALATALGQLAPAPVVNTVHLSAGTYASDIGLMLSELRVTFVGGTA